MILNIDNLKKTGAFTGSPVKKKIKWFQNDEEFEADVYVRRLSYLSAMSDIASIQDNTDAAAGRIASSICNKEGKAIFKPGDITGEADPDRGALDYNLTVELLRVIGEVNSLGKQTTSQK